MPRYSRETIKRLKSIGKRTEQSRFRHGVENPLPTDRENCPCPRCTGKLVKPPKPLKRSR